MRKEERGVRVRQASSRECMLVETSRLSRVTIILSVAGAILVLHVSTVPIVIGQRARPFHVGQARRADAPVAEMRSTCFVEYARESALPGGATVLVPRMHTRALWSSTPSI